MKKELVMPLSELVRTSTWEDAKGTASSSSLIGPPVLEFSIYKKIPSNKKRSDARQGTIDQDPEFMAFLEELANPAPAKAGPEEDFGEDSAKTEVKITTTPLVEFLKEKKTRAKEASASKKSRLEAGSGKGKGSKEEDSPKKKTKDSKGDRSKEKVKILTKKAAAEHAAETAKVAAGKITAANSQDGSKSRRAGIAAAARMLQRDLGLSPGTAHRRARQDAAKADADAKTTVTKEPGQPTSETTGSPEMTAELAPEDVKGRPSTPPVTQKSQTSGRRGRGGRNAEKGKASETSTSQPASQASPMKAPVILKKGKGDTPQASAEVPAVEPKSSAKQATDAPASSKPSSNKPASSQKKAPSISPDCIHGFVKHASPSQGVTEAALREALEAFGAVTAVELDKRKGFAYVDFADHEGLLKAITASPVTVAQGSVQVVERKDKKPAAAAASNQGGAGASEKTSNRGRRGKGGGGGGGGGGGNGGGKSNAGAATTSAAAATPSSVGTG